MFLLCLVLVLGGKCVLDKDLGFIFGFFEVRFVGSIWDFIGVLYLDVIGLNFGL